MVVALLFDQYRITELVVLTPYFNSSMELALT